MSTRYSLSKFSFGAAVVGAWLVSAGSVQAQTTGAVDASASSAAAAATPSSPAPAASQASAATKPSTAGGEKVTCRASSVTGSRLQKRTVCSTPSTEQGASDWAREQQAKGGMAASVNLPGG